MPGIENCLLRTLYFTLFHLSVVLRFYLYYRSALNLKVNSTESNGHSFLAQPLGNIWSDSVPRGLFLHY